MSEKINLKELQRKAWRSIFQDGLWDIFMGLLLLNIAVYTFAGQYFADDLKLGLFFGGEIGALLLLWLGKRFITVPRLGMVNFGRFGQARRSKAKLTAFASILIGLILLLLLQGSGQNGRVAGLSHVYFVAVAWVLNALLVFGLAAYFLDFNRLYLIGTLFALSFPVDIILRELWNTQRWAYLAYAIPALLVLALGLFSLLKFLRKYPVTGEDA